MRLATEGSKFERIQREGELVAAVLVGDEK